MRTITHDPLFSQETFLDGFPVARRSLVSNQFFNAVRSGATTIDETLRGVKSDAISRMLFATGAAWNTQRQLLSLLETEAARLFAREILDRERLPPAEKLRLKAERSEQYRREYLRAKPPTTKQLTYLKMLKCETTPRNMLEASALIERHKR